MSGTIRHKVGCISDQAPHPSEELGIHGGGVCLGDRLKAADDLSGWPIESSGGEPGALLRWRRKERIARKVFLCRRGVFVLFVLFVYGVTLISALVARALAE
jgi:hypothetical protein